ncbi:MAG: DUF2892 domain-containing protein [FCB group bacterium]|nr:DUF2892 domain-containing protein [FCB group bacterium]
MKKNMGTLDRGIRVLLAVVVAILYFAGQISGLAAIILGIVAVIFLVTSAIGFCPLYSLLKLNTVRNQED